MISCFFITGTGRCGSLLLSKVLNCSNVTECHHERSIDTRKMKKAYMKNKIEILRRSLERNLIPEVKRCNASGKIYGECSGHLYPIFEELYRRYENTARFVLLVRHPVNFVRSALARGFFSPGHPNALEHVVPPKDTAIGEEWQNVTSLEKCAWYWAMVNGRIYGFFLCLAPDLYRIVRIETISVEVIRNLYDFFGLNDFDQAKPMIEELISVRHNASPGQGDERNANPFSKHVEIGPKETWDPTQVDAFEKHVLPLEKAFYGDNSSEYLNTNTLCVLRDTGSLRG